ncbi:MAG: helix-hairpin-helix domain-containing protein [Clostridium sp.]|uniref:helix-hairpin-helix domain-containing protein n=1 Tax=Clostridium sp. DSM 8431 TaxID=1761781 RepID=UPI0008E55B69|nr:helix-hairpin-helix domain-containing protein [Clostridium sp. DSM 8431]MCR4944241.1 helix-hairpin-helix domain-containing protein [Clostridium sp.]SFU66411.1 competence protein ComEA [Clostridium sp. DSM 8431]
MRKKYKFIGILVFTVFILIFLIASYIRGGRDELIKNESEDIYEEDVKEIEASSSESEIVVEIKGCIKNPNVYWLSENSIVEDLISAAGGLTENADTSSVNRAEKLKNHQLVIIPDKDSAKNEISKVDILGKEKGNLSSSLVNINTADEKELDSLPGIGPARAKDIIRYREENGEFKSIEDIKNVKGIGENYYEKLKDKITV